MPMWRAMNWSASSSSRKGRAACISMASFLV